MSKTNTSPAWLSADPFRPAPPPAAAPAAAPPSAAARALCAAALLPLVAWLYLRTFRWLADKWLHDPGYSHGILVPFFALYLARRRQAGRPLSSAGGAALGYGLVALA